MCGICGILGPESSSDSLGAMLGTIIHRGPDAEGRLERPGMALGMRRLAIIDLAGGDQPIFNEDGTVATVFNGEIYNFAELRDELIRDGHTFATRSDTEVLVHGYEQWGQELPHRLRGMFAFAILDARRDSVLIARDRFGKKPLYYARHEGRLLIASEIKALLAAGVAADIDEGALGAYLALRYVPAPRTMFRGISQLPAGHLMRVASGDVEIERWWRLVYGPKHQLDAHDAAERAEELIRDSVRMRMISDVPLGCFLSGGLDSSLVLSFMTELSDEPVRTFSIGFDPDWASDELDAARATANAFGAKHRETRVGASEFLSLLPDAVWFRDEPLAEPSEIPLLALSRMAREDVTVVLSGEGGDELFGGYPKYRVDRVLSRVGSVTRLASGNGSLRRLLGSRRLPRKTRLALAAVTEADEARRWAGWFGADAGFDPPGIDRLALAERATSLDPGLGSLDAMMALDVESYLVDNLLVRGDKMTMGASIEGRMPLLDHVVAEFAARLPESIKASARTTKIVPRELARRRLPAALLDRPKIGFAVPVSRWFHGELGDAALALLTDPVARRRGLFAPADARAAVERHRGGHDLGKELWSVLVLEVWARIFLDGEDPKELDLRARAAVG
jgi:asparagine synthase (glutamine-hydrolysing)